MKKKYMPPETKGYFKEKSGETEVEAPAQPVGPRHTSINSDIRMVIPTSFEKLVDRSDQPLLLEQLE